MRPIDADALLRDIEHYHLSDGKFQHWVEIQPTIEPERSEIIPDTKAVPTDCDCVNLSERVTATYYDDEYDEWSQKTVTIRDVLDGVCDEYTVIEPEREKGKWLPENRTMDAFWVCSSCGFPSEAHAANILYKFCPNCGADMRGEKDG